MDKPYTISFTPSEFDTICRAFLALMDNYSQVAMLAPALLPDEGKIHRIGLELAAHACEAASRSADTGPDADKIRLLADEVEELKRQLKQ